MSYLSHIVGVGHSVPQLPRNLPGVQRKVHGLQKGATRGQSKLCYYQAGLSIQFDLSHLTLATYQSLHKIVKYGFRFVTFP